MNREACKFFAGSFAALAYAHAAYAVATSSGLVDEPVFLGRRWGVGYMWTEAAVYSALSVTLGYLGWRGPRGTAQLPPSDRQARDAVAETDAHQETVQESEKGTAAAV
ncbi:hypothetical protein [Mycolicibacterium chlorophenolicum]|uniref:Integral membrane protein n=1 Tax=Mycolicibacterium chlorophenolicum TaxID=37916 RepID=A0A0J6VLC3_9MYCO|nr:hypothetical protein [Mycolicibacterium chlorophenolicum]KMO70352.1 hypothetical protein MCHLDSM_05240 [Mycolicibacterium chlorophenolicum]